MHTHIKLNVNAERSKWWINLYLYLAAVLIAVKKMTVVVEFSVIPLGVGISLSRFLAPALKELDRRGVKYEITPMCTIFEAENAAEALDMVKAAHEAVFKNNVKRVVTYVKIDDRRDIKRGMKEKAESLSKAVNKI